LDGQPVRQPDSQTGRQTDTWIDRRQTGRHAIDQTREDRLSDNSQSTGRHLDGQADRPTYSPTDSKTKSNSKLDSKTDREIDRQTDRQTDR
jgi:hypothetical protein